MKCYLLPILILSAISCKDITELSDKDLPVTLQKLIKDNQIDSFLVDSIRIDSFLVDSIRENFEWDQLYILKPYLTETQYAAVERKVDNMPWMGPAGFTADWNIYFVFVRNGKAIKFSEVVRYPYDFIAVGKYHNPVLVEKGTFLQYKKQSDGRIIIW